MKTFYSDYLELAESIYDKVVNEECNVGVVGDYWTIESILQNLIYTDANNDQTMTLTSVDLHNPEMNNYEGLYLLTVSEYCEIYVEMAVTSNGKLCHFDNDVLYVQMEFWEVVKDSIDDNEVIDTVIFTDNQKEFEAFKEDDGVTLLTDEGVVKTIVFEKNNHGYCMHAEICSCNGFEDKTISEIVDGLVEVFNKGI